MFVQACLNGNRAAGTHPALPVTPNELAEDARRVVEAGAGSIHVHPRRADGTESLEREDCAAVLAEMTAAVPDTPIGFTTAAWIEPDPLRRAHLAELWTPSPAFASVNLSEDGIELLIGALLRRGIGVEAGLANVGDARRLVKSGLADRCSRFLIEVEEDDPDAAVAAGRAIEAVLSAFRPPRLHHGTGPMTWTVIAAALERGRDVRIGLEDTLTVPDGRSASGNAELVAEVVRMAGATGRES